MLNDTKNYVMLTKLFHFENIHHHYSYLYPHTNIYKKHASKQVALEINIFIMIDFSHFQFTAPDAGMKFSSQEYCDKKMRSQ